ncbi:STAS domain-containing protein [Kibdelosporangium philippinense]|uniref:Anti-sigma factor antagonist n=1 Tax=Kibdelosporangium philippinense TaxID=211113 RepID=A0ABS8Z6Q9_9PSEU|nr:STAS domain-containing protein [Kibdelosporangium philippinense]MCE7003500.1 STAS domain-containing protein [Kibdelosporangium philippinense]
MSKGSTSDDPLRVDRRVAGPAVVLHVAGEIDMSTAPMLAEECDQAIESAPGRLVVDLSDVTFFGSAGLAVLLDAHQRGEQEGVQVRLVADGRPVLRSIEIAGVQEMLPVYPDLENALA